MRYVTEELMDGLLAQAAAADRRRCHYNLHPTLDDPVQRLLIAAVPETVFPTHRHRAKWELAVLLRGRIDAVFFDDDGRVTDRCVLAADGDCSVLEIPAGQWHLYRVRVPSVVLEVKPGPYEPIAPEDTAEFS